MLRVIIPVSDFACGNRLNGPSVFWMISYPPLELAWRLSALIQRLGRN